MNLKILREAAPVYVWSVMCCQNGYSRRAYFGHANEEGVRPRSVLVFRSKVPAEDAPTEEPGWFVADATDRPTDDVLARGPWEHWAHWCYTGGSR